MSRLITFWRVLWALLMADRFVAVAYWRNRPETILLEISPEQDYEGAMTMLREASRGLVAASGSQQS